MDKVKSKVIIYTSDKSAILFIASNHTDSEIRFLILDKSVKFSPAEVAKENEFTKKEIFNINFIKPCEETQTNLLPSGGN